MKKYENPIKRNGDFADPCVIRYNGRYYLYCTNPDIRCWSSVDLINWEVEGPVIGPEEFPGLVPFAPEVVYWNGEFYMYTSPHGLGHYVLKSNSPTGPFRKISDNFAHNIDGHVFIDDDGEWYFYWADFAGIMGCHMKSPIELGEPVNTGVYMYGWTEGPYVMKHNGCYYMTYTGNHYLSSGYRINAAVSDHPLSGYQEDANNPILIHTEGKNIGLGHSTSTLGPDLKSYYMVYHNINPDASRDLNIDFQTWHGKSTKVYGPTRTSQPAPLLPDYQDIPAALIMSNWEILKGSWKLNETFYHVAEEEFLCLTTKGLSGCGCAEMNLRSDGTSGKYGIVFGWTDSFNYYKAEFVSGQGRIDIIKVEYGIESILKRSELPGNYQEMALHTIRLVIDHDGLAVFVDNRKQMVVDITVGKGSFGYFADRGAVSIGYTGFSSGTLRDTEKELYKPVPGSLPAVTALEDIRLKSDHETIQTVTGDTLTYHLNVEHSGSFDVNLFGSFFMHTQWCFSVDGMEGDKIDYGSKGRGVLTFSVEMEEGEHVFQLKLLQGKASLEKIEITEAVRLAETVEYKVRELGTYGKQIFGEGGWSDYTIQADLKVDLQSEGGEAGILFRVAEPSEGGEGADTILGINFFLGYFVGWTGSHLILSKHSYDKKILCQRELILEEQKRLKVSVQVEGDCFYVFVGNEKQPFLAYHDETPFTHGRVGVRAVNAQLNGAITINN